MTGIQHWLGTFTVSQNRSHLYFNVHMDRKAVKVCYYALTRGGQMEPRSSISTPTLSPEKNPLMSQAGHPLFQFPQENTMVSYGSILNTPSIARDHAPLLDSSSSDSLIAFLRPPWVWILYISGQFSSLSGSNLPVYKHFD